MSWHTNAILIRNDLSKDYDGLFEKLGLIGGQATGTVSFDDAASTFNEGVAVGTVDGLTALWGSLALVMVDEKALAKIAKKSNVLQIILEGTSSTAGFTWWNDGKVVRKWMRQDGEVIMNDGKPLREEKKAFIDEDDEQAVLRLLMSLTLPLANFQAIEYQMYSFPEDALFG